MADSKARASGYNHTYFDNRDLDAFALSMLPSSDDIALLSQTARDEADMLVTACGVNITTMRQLSSFLARGRVLPSLDTWFVGTGTEDDEDDGFSDTASIGDAEELQELLDHVGSEKFTKTATKEQQKITGRLSCAAAALMAEDHRKVCVVWHLCFVLLVHYSAVNNSLRRPTKKRRKKRNCSLTKSASWTGI
jgi:hypothetical protein